MRALVLSLAVLALAGCADWNVAKSGRVYQAHVTAILESGHRDLPDAMPQRFQRLEVQIDEGLYSGDRVTVPWSGRGALNSNGLLRVGDRVFVSNQRAPDGSRSYAIEEVERFPSLAPFALLLVMALIVVSRLKGLAALGGLVASVGVFVVVVVPAVREGRDPLVATLVAILAVLVVSVYVVHGLNRKSTAALIGAAGSLAVVAALAVVGLWLSHLTGLGSEESIYLSVSTEGRIDMPRLLLAGMVVASLGALVDMSVGQASATFELAAVDRALRGRDLYRRAINVGHDHVGSLVNTLALAYFGAALPLAVLLSVGNAPVVLGLNSETITLSLLSVLVASIGLVLCVPLTTAVAVRLAPRR